MGLLATFTGLIRTPNSTSFSSNSTTPSGLSSSTSSDSSASSPLTESSSASSSSSSDSEEPSRTNMPSTAAARRLPMDSERRRNGSDRALSNSTNSSSSRLPPIPQGNRSLLERLGLRGVTTIRYTDADIQAIYQRNLMQREEQDERVMMRRYQQDQRQRQRQRRQIQRQLRLQGQFADLDNELLPPPPGDEYGSDREDLALEDIPPYSANLHKYLDVMSFDQRFTPVLRINRHIISSDDDELLIKFIQHFSACGKLPQSINLWEISHVDDSEFEQLIPNLIPITSSGETGPDDGNDEDHRVDTDYMLALYLTLRDRGVLTTSTDLVNDNSESGTRDNEMASAELQQQRDNMMRQLAGVSSLPTSPVPPVTSEFSTDDVINEGTISSPRRNRMAERRRDTPAESSSQFEVAGPTSSPRSHENGRAGRHKHRRSRSAGDNLTSGSRHARRSRSDRALRDHATTDQAHQQPVQREQQRQQREQQRSQRRQQEQLQQRRIEEQRQRLQIRQEQELEQQRQRQQEQHQQRLEEQRRLELERQRQERQHRLERQRIRQERQRVRLERQRLEQERLQQEQQEEARKRQEEIRQQEAREREERRIRVERQRKREERQRQREAKRKEERERQRTSEQQRITQEKEQQEAHSREVAAKERELQARQEEQQRKQREKLEIKQRLKAEHAKQKQDQKILKKEQKEQKHTDSAGSELDQGTKPSSKRKPQSPRTISDRHTPRVVKTRLLKDDITNSNPFSISNTNLVTNPENAISAGSSHGTGENAEIGKSVPKSQSEGAFKADKGVASSSTSSLRVKSSSSSVVLSVASSTSRGSSHPYRPQNIIHTNSSNNMLYT